MGRRESEITQEILLQNLSYNQDTGEFTWIAKTQGARIQGRRAGFLHSSGYRYIHLKGHDRFEHRLAFLYVEGRWPKEEIDHKNRIKSDNKYTNLREATRGQNVKNVLSRKDNSSGISGVHWCNTHQRWIVQVQVDGKRIKGGRFVDFQKAVEQRNKLVTENHGEFGVCLEEAG